MNNTIERNRLAAALVLAALLNALPATAAGHWNCGWIASSWRQGPSIMCGSAGDCYRVFAYKDAARTIPVTIYSRLGGMLNRVTSTDDCEDRYTKEHYYDCTMGLILSRCNWWSPLPSNPVLGFEQGYCRLVTKGDCHNRFGGGTGG